MIRPTARPRHLASLQIVIEKHARLKYAKMASGRRHGLAVGRITGIMHCVSTRLMVSQVTCKSFLIYMVKLMGFGGHEMRNDLNVTSSTIRLVDTQCVVPGIRPSRCMARNHIGACSLVDIRIVCIISIAHEPNMEE